MEYGCHSLSVNRDIKCTLYHRESTIDERINGYPASHLRFTNSIPKKTGTYSTFKFKLFASKHIQPLSWENPIGKSISKLTPKPYNGATFDVKPTPVQICNGV